MSRLRIVIVNWNAGDLLRACLASIPAAVGPDMSLEAVVVVDNASSDGSADGLGDLALPLRVIRNAENRGFAAACNQGAEGSTADHLLFLNPDTRLLADSLRGPARFLADPNNAGVGIVGIQLLDEDGEVARSSARFPSLRGTFGQAFGLDHVAPRAFPPHFMTEWDHADTREVDQVIGAFFWIRRPLFETLDGFDERFFVYYEEVDLSRRVREAGFSAVYLSDVQAYHEGAGTTERVKALRLFLVLRSRILYGYKHYRRPAARAAALLTLVAEPVSRVALLAARRDWSGVRDTLGGFRMLWAQSRTLLRGEVPPPLPFDSLS